MDLVLESDTKRWVVRENPRTGKPEPVAETPTYRLYVCVEAAGEREYLLQVATDVEYNGLLDRAAFNLGWLKHTADEMERKYPDPSGNSRHYDRLFPRVTDNFIFTEQGNRRVVVLEITDVPDVSTRMYALSRYRDVGALRIDLESSAWIMGRLLKLLGLTQNQRIAVKLLTGSNVLISPEDHFAVVFDWTASVLLQSEMPAEERKQEIATAALTVFESIGGDPETGAYPYTDVTDQNYRYVELLWRLACQPGNDAAEAHGQFYELIDELWGIKFHPFNPLPM